MSWDRTSSRTGVSGVVLALVSAAIAQACGPDPGVSMHAAYCAHVRRVETALREPVEREVETTTDCQQSILAVSMQEYSEVATLERAAQIVGAAGSGDWLPQRGDLTFRFERNLDEAFTTCDTGRFEMAHNTMQDARGAVLEALEPTLFQCDQRHPVQ